MPSIKKDLQGSTDLKALVAFTVSTLGGRGHGGIPVLCGASSLQQMSTAHRGP